MGKDFVVMQKSLNLKTKPLTICPACGILLKYPKATKDNPRPNPTHKWRWNGNMFDSRLVCSNNPVGPENGEEFKQL